jgi:hypothetical protein
MFSLVSGLIYFEMLMLYIFYNILKENIFKYYFLILRIQKVKREEKQNSHEGKKNVSDRKKKYFEADPF